MTHRLFLTIPGALLLVAPFAGADEPARPDADRVRAVRQMYAKLPCDIIGFAEPAKKIVAVQKDGRALMLGLEDANGKRLTIYMLQAPGEWKDALLLTSGRLPARGPEESAVYGLLLRLSAKPPEKTADKLMEMVDTMLTALDQRFAGATPVAGKKAEK